MHPKNLETSEDLFISHRPFWTWKHHTPKSIFSLGPIVSKHSSQLSTQHVWPNLACSIRFSLIPGWLLIMITSNIWKNHPLQSMKLQKKKHCPKDMGRKILKNHHLLCPKTNLNITLLKNKFIFQISILGVPAHDSQNLNSGPLPFQKHLHLANLADGTLKLLYTDGIMYIPSGGPFSLQEAATQFISQEA